MIPLFVSSFAVGLVLGVYAMLHGVERRRRGQSWVEQAVTEPRARLVWPSAASFLFVFGLVGYGVSRTTELGAAARGLVAAGGAVVAVVLTILVIQAWAVPGARRAPEDPRYLLQGYPGTVTIRDGVATVAYEVDGTRHTAVARAIDGGVLADGIEVVIERIEDGVAYVEGWAAVEQRI